MRRILPAVVCLVIIGALAGCSRSKPEATDPLLEGRWLLVSFRDGSRHYSVPTDFIPFMDVDGNTFIFSSSCNMSGATFPAENGQLAVSPGVLRGMGCGDTISQAGVDLEYAVPNSMSRWSTYPFDNHQLRARINLVCTVANHFHRLPSDSKE